MKKVKKRQQHLYGSSRIGLSEPKVTWNSTGVVTDNPLKNNYNLLHLFGNKRYEISNHLGNVMSVITDRKRGAGISAGAYTYYLPAVLSSSDYYAFGMEMRTFSAGSYRYGFNGKENDRGNFGLQLVQDFTGRMYNPAVGRFLSIDPKPKAQESPFVAFSNSPMYIIDPDGNDSVIVHLKRARTNPLIEKATNSSLKTVLFKATFYLVQQGKWTEIEQPTLEKTGSNEFDFMMSSYSPSNSLQKRDYYDLTQQDMASHPEFKDMGTILISPTGGRGQYVHPGKTNEESAGCLIPCQGSNLQLQEYVPKSEGMIASVIVLSVDQKKNGKATGGVTYNLLKNMNSTFEKVQKENSMPDKPVGFLLTTKEVSKLQEKKQSDEKK